MGSVFCVSADQNYITTPVHIAFTKDEKDYIKENNSIQVALVEGFPLICEYNESEEKYEGIVMDALEQISERAGLQFQYTELPKDVLPWEYLESHPDTIMAPLLVNSIINYMDEMEILNTIVKSRMVAVSREGKAIDLDGKFVIVVPENLYGFEEKIYEKFPKAQIVYSSSHKDGLDMVNSAEADMTFVNEISGVYMLQSPYYSKLVITNTANFVEDVALTVSADANPRLISVMNKTISSLSERDVQQIVVNNMVSHSYEMSIQEWLYKNGAFIILLSIAVGGMIFSINRRQKQEKEEKQRIKIAEERHKKDVEYQKKMFYQANFDALTGLYNKNYFIEKAAELLEENPDVVYSFFRLNVKKFKMINEIYGQERGDIVLTKIADKLREDIGKEGVYGRVYSDHFAICYPVDEETLRKVRKVKVAHLNCKGQDIRVEINLGVYVNSSHYSDVVQLLDYAQIALQNEEKSNQQNMYFYKDCYMETLLRNQKITNEMENALRDKQFHIFLQPQFDHIEKKLVGAEALIRWFHPVEGMIPPNEFIPVFEGNRFIYKLDVYVCEEVCRLLAKWKEQGKLVPVSVNLSRIDLQNAGLLHMLQSTLEKYSIPIHYLHLEVTESAYVENYEEMLHVIEELREAGFLIEMDDFGSGYSSLNMLKDIPVDIIKLDMRFFGGETHMDKGGNIIETIVNLAHSLGLYVIAEGVETKGGKFPSIHSMSYGAGVSVWKAYACE